MSAGPTRTLVTAIAEQKDRLLPCVHCGFCLPACPTYNRLGDEADSPRGRLYLMQAVVEGRLDPGSDAFRTHIDRCLGCRACEPVCPSGVEYGTLLEYARETSTAASPPDILTRSLLAVMGSPAARALFFMGGRVMRGTGLASLGTRVLPRRGVLGSARLGLAMLASSGPWKVRSAMGGGTSSRAGSTTAPAGSTTAAASSATITAGQSPALSRRPRVGMLTGCVQQGLYGRVNDATRRVLEANAFEVVQVAAQDCCGALHAHAGALDGARTLARRNIDAFERAGVEAVVVNAAGCGATMKEYGTLLEHDDAYRERAARFSKTVRDVTEILADAGPRTGAEVACRVAYDHPCHLLHAQRIREAPLRVLAAIPGVQVHVVENAGECCGGAGIYGLTHPELGGRIGGDKVRAVCAVEADAVATPNPGCMMQIGAGLRLEGFATGAVHPVELLDESYRRAGYYRS